MSLFTEDQKNHITGIKECLKMAIQDLRMTAEKLGTFYQQGYFISGGCIGSLLRGELVNDYDVYFYTQKVGDRIVKLYTEDSSYTSYVKLAEAPYRDLQVGDKIITENAVTLKNGLQLITKHYGEPDVIRNTFDFEHCKPYYYPKTDKLYISPKQYILNMTKKLKLTGPDVIAYREQKFIDRGWTW